MQGRRKTRQEGVVLLAVVWSVFILASIAFALSALVRSGSEELRARKEQLQAYYAARGAVYRALSMVKQVPDKPDTAMPFVPGQSRIEWDQDGEHIVVDVMDETGKLDLNTADPAMLERLFMNLGMEFQAAHELVAAIEDWRDPDEDTRPAGAESLYYLGLPQPYRPANRDFRSIQELLLVRGVTPEAFYGRYVTTEDGDVQRRLGLIDCLTVDSHSSSVNINYAPLPVLLSVPRLSQEMANFIIEGRTKKPFASISDFVHDYPILLDGETASRLIAGSAGPYTFFVSATTSSGITARLRATVQVNGLTVVANQRVQPGPPFVILSWDDFYVR